MSTPYIGEIRMFGFGRTPNNWQACDGSLLAISEYDALFALIGTIYGGDGQTTFAVPDLRGRLPIHQGQGPGLSNYVIGQRAGTETVTLLSTQMPGHTHSIQATDVAGTAGSPTNSYLAAAPVSSFIPTASANATMAATSIGVSGGSQPHDNMQPFLTVQFCIALFGIFPSQS